MTALYDLSTLSEKKELGRKNKCLYRYYLLTICKIGDFYESGPKLPKISHVYSELPGMIQMGKFVTLAKILIICPI